MADGGQPFSAKNIFYPQSWAIRTATCSSFLPLNEAPPSLCSDEGRISR